MSYKFYQIKKNTTTIILKTIVQISNEVLFDNHLGNMYFYLKSLGKFLR